MVIIFVKTLALHCLKIFWCFFVTLDRWWQHRRSRRPEKIIQNFTEKPLCNKCICIVNKALINRSQTFYNSWCIFCPPYVSLSLPLSNQNERLSYLICNNIIQWRRGTLRAEALGNGKVTLFICVQISLSSLAITWTGYSSIVVVFSIVKLVCFCCCCFLSFFPGDVLRY